MEEMNSNIEQEPCGEVQMNAEIDSEELFSQQFLGTLHTSSTNLATKMAVDEEVKTNVTSVKTKKHCEPVVKSPRQTRRNARERGRKARLNAAFQVLRSMVPQTVDQSQERKLTQVEILRLAKSYICGLTSLLQDCDDDVSSHENALTNIFHPWHSHNTGLLNI